MSLPDQPPRISKWFFLLSDALLVAVAAFIATHSATPLSNTVILSIVGCVGIGAIVTGFAFIADYTRQQDEALDDRQRALEALARTVNTSAEQISIAANGLHEIAELVQKNLKHAEQLPHKLQEKIAEFQAQLANANDADREELEKEVADLRTSESERLESIADKIAKSTADWVKLEAAAQKHLAAASDAIAKAQSSATAAIDGKFTSALSALDAKLAAFDAKLATATELAERTIESAAKAATAAAAATVPVLPPPAAPPANPLADPSASTPTEPTAHPPKRPRKPRREESAAEESPSDTPSAPVPESPASSATPENPAAPPPVATPTETKFEEPPPISIEKIPEIVPVAPHTAEPFSSHAVPPAPPTPPAPPAAISPADAPAPEAPKPPRKRPQKKPEPEPAEPALGLDIQETPAAQSAEVAERVLTSDGATRLVVTAYIGIGNRLFIRGDGPGLGWDKGVPLQFISIGKWRWETNDATAPVKFKLYKNDETECTALGVQTLDPGHQQEVTASF